MWVLVNSKAMQRKQRIIRISVLGNWGFGVRKTVKIMMIVIMGDSASYSHIKEIHFDYGLCLLNQTIAENDIEK